MGLIPCRAHSVAQRKKKKKEMLSPKTEGSVVISRSKLDPHQMIYSTYKAHTVGFFVIYRQIRKTGCGSYTTRVSYVMVTHSDPLYKLCIWVTDWPN